MIKVGDLVKYLVEDSICDLDGSDDATLPTVGVVIMCRANTVDVLRQGNIDRMVPVGWLEVIHEG